MRAAREPATPSAERRLAQCETCAPAAFLHSQNALACVGPRRQGREWPHVLMDSDHGETPPHGDWATNGVLLLRLDGDDAARSPRNVLDAED